MRSIMNNSFVYIATHGKRSIQSKNSIHLDNITKKFYCSKTFYT